MPRNVSLTIGALSVGGALTFARGESVGVDDTMSAVLTAAGFVLGTTEPNATNAGLSNPGASFTVLSGADLIITTNGTTYTNYDFRCWVFVRAAGVSFFNCKFQGPASVAPSGGQPLLICYNAAVADLWVERCWFRPLSPTDTTDAIHGFNYTMIRNDISRTVDGGGTYIPIAVGTEANCLVQGDYRHDLFYGSPNSGQSDNHTHNDVNQHHNGTNVTFEGCSLNGYWATDVGINQNLPGTFDGTGRVISGNCNDNDGHGLGLRNVNCVAQINRVSGGVSNDFHWINNWMYGGATTFNLAGVTSGITTFEITGNRIEPPMLGRGVVIYAQSSATLVQCSGNTYTDTGLAMLGTVGNGRTNIA